MEVNALNIPYSDQAPSGFPLMHFSILPFDSLDHVHRAFLKVHLPPTFMETCFVHCLHTERSQKPC